MEGDQDAGRAGMKKCLVGRDPENEQQTEECYGKNEDPQDMGLSLVFQDQEDDH